MQNKKILLWLFLAVIFVMGISEITVAEEGRMINFIRDEKALDEILTMVKTSGKTGLLYFTADWCAPCYSMKKYVFTNEILIEFVESNFISFYIDYESSKYGKLKKHFSVEGIPNLVFINENGKIIDRIVGYGPPPRQYLNRIANVIGKNFSEEEVESAFYLEIPKDPVSRYNYAKELYEKRLYEDALNIFETILDKKIDDANKEVWKYIYLAKCYSLTNYLEKAIETYEDAINKGVINEIKYKALVFSNLGQLYFLNNQFEKAINYIEMLPEEEHIEKINESSIQFSVMRAKQLLPFCYGKIGQLEKGKQLYETYCRTEVEKKDHMSIIFINGYCSEHKLYLKEALSWEKEALNVLENHIKEERLKLSNATTEEERKEIERMIKGLEGNNYGHIITSYATIAGFNEKYDLAINLWEKLKEISERRSSQSTADVSIAALLLKSGKTNEGKHKFQELLTEAGNDPEKLSGLVWACNRYDINLKEALQWAKRAVDLASEDDRAENLNLYLYANLLFKNGKIEEAIRVGTEAYEKFPNYQLKNDLEKFKAALK